MSASLLQPTDGPRDALCGVLPVLVAVVLQRNLNSSARCDGGGLAQVGNPAPARRHQRGARLSDVGFCQWSEVDRDFSLVRDALARRIAILAPLEGDDLASPLD